MRVASREKQERFEGRSFCTSASPVPGGDITVPELAIADVAFGGKGVARDNGKAVFIPFTIDGERVTAKIVREKKQFAEAQLRRTDRGFASPGGS